jgi:hypothetical protein
MLKVVSTFIIFGCHDNDGRAEFSEDEISEYALTGSILLTLSTGLFLLGVYLLKGQKNG